MAEGAQEPTSGDNSVDNVDNSVTSSEGTGSAGTTLRGPDLARAALEAAREQARSRRKRHTSGGHAGSRRRGWSGPRADDRDPQRFGLLLTRIASDRGWSGRLADAEVFGRWRTLVGEDIAEHTNPVALQDGELTVQAESTAWATQLRLLQRQILKRISDGVGRDVVRRIKVQGPAAPSWRYGPRHVPGRGPRDTYG
jgi:predicted nucleic acid-binding Zn ribbon protein